MLSKASHFLSSVAATSPAFDSFAGNIDPELGPFHPMNTFRSPFAMPRSKVSWYMKTIVEIKASEIGEIVIDENAVGGADVLIAVSEPDADVYWRGEKGDEFLIDALETRQNFEPAIPTTMGGNYFFQHSANRFFPICALNSVESSNSLVFKKSGLESMYAFVAVLTSGEAKSLEARSRQGILPPIVESSLFVPCISKQFVSNENRIAIIPAKEVPKGCVSGLFIRGLKDEDVVTVSFSAPKEWREHYGESEILVFRSPAKFIGNETPLGRYWETSFSDSLVRKSFPPPMFGIDLEYGKYSGNDGDLIISAQENCGKIDVRLTTIKFLLFEENGVEPRWV